MSPSLQSVAKVSNADHSWYRQLKETWGIINRHQVHGVVNVYKYIPEQGIIIFTIDAIFKSHDVVFSLELRHGPNAKANTNIAIYSAFATVQFGDLVKRNIYVLKAIDHGLLMDAANFITAEGVDNERSDMMNFFSQKLAVQFTKEDGTSPFEIQLSQFRTVRRI